jgi:hypothetical protein
MGITEINKIPLLFCCWDAQMRGPDKPHSFGGTITSNEISMGMFAYMKKEYPNIKNIAIAGVIDERTATELVVRNAKKFGYNIVFLEHIKYGTPDWMPLLTKMTATNADAFYPICLTPGDAALILQQKYQIGYEGLVASACIQSIDLLTEKAGVDAIESYTFAAPIFEGPDALPGFKKLHDTYKAKYGDFDVVTSAVYHFPEVLKLAIEKAGTLDGDAVANAISNLEAPYYKGRFSFGGLKTYGSKSQIQEPVHITQISNGKQVYKGAFPGVSD